MLNQGKQSGRWAERSEELVAFRERLARTIGGVRYNGCAKGTTQQVWVSEQFGEQTEPENLRSGTLGAARPCPVWSVQLTEVDDL